MLIASLIAVPLGYAIGHTGKLRGFSIATSGGVRALPTLGVLSLFGLLLGIGLEAPLLALVILAIPSVLAGAYSGIESVEPVTVDAAKAQGMTAGKCSWKVEIPLGLPLLIGASERPSCRSSPPRRSPHTWGPAGSAGTSSSG